MVERVPGLDAIANEVRLPAIEDEVEPDMEMVEL